MNTKNAFVSCILVISISMACKNKETEPAPVTERSGSEYYTEPYRPQFHFTPQQKWMNDPNGLVHNNGIYHLFYQYYPEDIVWGPMHWGHATSEDLIHWEHKPIALYPDEHGLIFSGSAVVDHANTSGFGTGENPPVVAIFTYHLMEGEKAGRTDFQTQGIAYSLDNGDIWAKYKGNPVLGNDGIKDFRDPKVFWNEQENLWTMLLVAGDRLQIYNSPDLKAWEKVSEFGKDQGAHGGVWECPDMFKLMVDGSDEEKWVLLISINPGAPNGGSGTQYFIGDFDGKTFTSDQQEDRWLDWGTDNYAGVTYNDTPDGERIFIGWMSNWTYARNTPTEKWRSAMTLPRNLSLRKTGDSYDLINYPIKNFDVILEEGPKKNIDIGPNENKVVPFEHLQQSEVSFTTISRNFRLIYKNESEEEMILTMKGADNEFSLDRSQSGKTDFQEDFKNMMKMPLDNLPVGEVEVRIIMDWSSVEVFINKGQYVMTAQVFPNENYNTFKIENTSKDQLKLVGFKVKEVKRIW